jgi:hypothetical protein
MVKTMKAVLATTLVMVAFPAVAQPAYPHLEPGATRVRNPGVQAPPTPYEVDLDYCLRLSGLWLRFVGGNEGSSGSLARRPDAEGRYAVERCEKGDPAAGIPILERKLVNNRFTLPPRG